MGIFYNTTVSSVKRWVICEFSSSAEKTDGDDVVTAKLMFTVDIDNDVVAPNLIARGGSTSRQTVVFPVEVA